MNTNYRVRLQVVEFKGAFIIQVLEQDMEYTRKVLKTGVAESSRGWTLGIDLHNGPGIYDGSKNIYLRGSRTSDDLKLIVYNGENYKYVLQDVLATVKEFFEYLDEPMDEEESESMKSYEVTF